MELGNERNAIRLRPVMGTDTDTDTDSSCTGSRNLPREGRVRASWRDGLRIRQRIRIGIGRGSDWRTSRRRARWARRGGRPCSCILWIWHWWTPRRPKMERRRRHRGRRRGGWSRPRRVRRLSSRRARRRVPSSLQDCNLNLRVRVRGPRRRRRWVVRRGSWLRGNRAGWRA